MRNSLLIGAALATMAFTLPSSALDPGVADDAMGLSKSSVYDDPAPGVFDYAKDAPGSSETIPVSYPSAPPMIPHDSSAFLPITREANACTGCHVQPGLVGTTVVKGVATPAPASHYADLKAGQLHMGRWNCTQCHSEQAKVNLLVESSFEVKAPAK